MKKLTLNRKIKYLKAGGVICPFCGSHHIISESIEPYQNGASSDVYCDNCKHSWKDIFKLIDVENAD